MPDTRKPRKYDPEFEKWWTDVGVKVCRFDKKWFIEETKYVASVAFSDGKKLANDLINFNTVVIEVPKDRP